MIDHTIKHNMNAILALLLKEYGSTDSGVQSRTADLNRDST